MKKFVLIMLVFCAVKTYAQQRGNAYADNRYNNNYNENSTYNQQQIRIVDTTQEITADMLPYKTAPTLKNDRYYFWYLDKVIHSTQGGYSGQLLNGHYIAFYPDKNLKEEGYFKSGLKDGEWKTWNRKGDLTSVVNWSEGVTVPDGQQPFWKKIPLINKKNDQQQAARPAGN